jgi:hypothetical protein
LAEKFRVCKVTNFNYRCHMHSLRVKKALEEVPVDNETMTARIARYVHINALEATYQDHKARCSVYLNRAVLAAEANVGMLPKRAGEPAGKYAHDYIHKLITLRDQVASLNQVQGALLGGRSLPVRLPYYDEFTPEIRKNFWMNDARCNIDCIFQLYHKFRKPVMIRANWDGPMGDFMLTTYISACNDM